jgi:hypothetical protein
MTKALKNKALLVALVLMAALHHDFWFWNDPTLVFGYLPVGLAYHALYSVVAGAFWFVVLTYAWPSELEEFARPEQEGKLRE